VCTPCVKAGVRGVRGVREINVNPVEAEALQGHTVDLFSEKSTNEKNDSDDVAKGGKQLA